MDNMEQQESLIGRQGIVRGTPIFSSIIHLDHSFLQPTPHFTPSHSCQLTHSFLGCFHQSSAQSFSCLQFPALSCFTSSVFIPSLLSLYSPFFVVIFPPIPLYIFYALHSLLVCTPVVYSAYISSYYTVCAEIRGSTPISLWIPLYLSMPVLLYCNYCLYTLDPRLPSCHPR